jgi:hypothetical protein
VERRVEPDVGVLSLNRTCKECLHVLVQRLVDPGDVALGNPVDPGAFDQIIDLAGRHALT